jgi:transposase
MFIRASQSQGRTYLRLVEAYRDEHGRSRHRQIAQLGRADQPGTQDKLDKLRRSLERHTGVDEAIATDLHFDPARTLGPSWVLTELWRELGFDDQLRRALRSSQREFDLESVIRVLVFNRLCDPKSKLGVLRWLERVHLPGLDTRGLHHQRLLRAMDALIANCEAVEQVTAQQLKPLLDSELSVVFYDVTSVRIHGDHECDDDLRQHGMSKDVHGVARQFALGVVQTAEGIPIAHEVFEGNVAETQTIAPMIRRVLSRYQLKRVVVVADRGLLSLDNVETLEALAEQEGLAVDYILAVPARRYGEFTDVMADLHPQLAEAAANSGDEAVAEARWQGRRVVVSHNPERAAEQTRVRRRKIERIEQFGQALAERLDNQEAGKPGRGRRSSDRSAHRRFHQMVLRHQMSQIVQADLGAEQFRYAIDDTAWAAAERLDGKLLLVTSLDELEAEAIVARYRSLTDIERGFRALKSTLDIAPVHHRLPDRIRAHALICFLALVLYRVLRLRLQANATSTSVERALEALETVQRHCVEINGRPHTGISLTKHQKELFNALEVKPPSQDAVS